ncbi:hypothetical protein KM043_000507 [Ampulex compressa]|nr:hypothetical protein KM043_000507 [Ampulex compressa]
MFIAYIAEATFFGSATWPSSCPGKAREIMVEKTRSTLTTGARDAANSGQGKADYDAAGQLEALADRSKGARMRGERAPSERISDDPIAQACKNAFETSLVTFVSSSGD